MRQTIVRAGGMLLAMMIVCGLLYTVALTGIGQVVFPRQANGSVIEIDGKVYGSELLGQQFTDNGHLWGRIMNLDVNSFTDENGQPVMYAWASNLSPASPDYEALVAERVKALRASNPTMDETIIPGEASIPGGTIIPGKTSIPGGASIPDEMSIPVDLVTCSGSGLDPEISPDAAEYQVARIAAARGISEDEVRQAIDRCTTGRFLGIFGEPRVNVLKVNLILDGIWVG